MNSNIEINTTRGLKLTEQIFKSSLKDDPLEMNEWNLATNQEELAHNNSEAVDDSKEVLTKQDKGQKVS